MKTSVETAIRNAINEVEAIGGPSLALVEVTALLGKALARVGEYVESHDAEAK